MSRRIIILVLIIKAIVLLALLVMLLRTNQQTTSYLPQLYSQPEVKTVFTEVIGYSHNDRPITAHHFGTGEKKLLLVGGIHGGYEWNTVLLAEEMIAHFKHNHHTIPPEVTIIIIPALNPDGLVQTFATTTLLNAATATIASSDLRAGRRNGRDVDLNRNFDCNWEPSATWQSEAIGAGSEPFSEPEAMALRDFVLKHSPYAAVVWHSQAGAVYGATCGSDIHEENLELLSVYSNATSYDAYPLFSDYKVTGDVESWLTTLGTHALTVELTTRTESEFEENLAAITATVDWLAEK